MIEKGVLKSSFFVSFHEIVLVNKHQFTRAKHHFRVILNYN